MRVRESPPSVSVTRVLSRGQVQRTERQNQVRDVLKSEVKKSSVARGQDICSEFKLRQAVYQRYGESHLPSATRAQRERRDRIIGAPDQDQGLHHIRSRSVLSRNVPACVRYLCDEYIDYSELSSPMQY